MLDIAPLCVDCEPLKHEEIHQGKKVVAAGAFKPEAVLQHALLQLIIQPIFLIQGMSGT
ncbi:hypothetical protein SDC9_174719 [bioreactor metagenome]|uniref:Uncharacterized protein n=1 Tax=bioreactor metagenome TaxID=1076179 RepID=A0A645GK37_9ZZZZ